MWEISNSLQSLTFIYSLALGFIFCVAYDILRAIRSAVKTSDITVFFEDIIFFVISSFITFIFLLATTNGEVRGYVIVGIILGFMINFLTFSRLNYKILRFVFLKIYNAYKAIYKILHTYSAKAYRFIVKNLRKWLNSCKKVLKKVKVLLYTKKA